MFYDQIDLALVDHGIAVKRGHWFEPSDIPPGGPPPWSCWREEAEIARTKEGGRWEEIRRKYGHIDQRLKVNRKIRARWDEINCDRDLNATPLASQADTPRMLVRDPSYLPFDCSAMSILFESCALTWAWQTMEWRRQLCEDWPGSPLRRNGEQPFEKRYLQDAQKSAAGGESDLFIRYKNLNNLKKSSGMNFSFEPLTITIDQTNMQVPVPDILPLLPLPGTDGFDLIIGRLYMDTTHPLSIALRHLYTTVKDVYAKKNRGLEVEGLVVRPLEEEGDDGGVKAQDLESQARRKGEEEPDSSGEGGDADDELEDDEMLDWKW
ncbi:hypothetical protein IAR50_003625 [Cryptococcus sp. DSM 104548]